MKIIGQTYATLVDTYTVKAVLGEGGSGRVLAVVSESGEEFALKALKGDRIASEKLRRFRNEIAFCKRSVHPGVLQVLDDGFVMDGSSKLPFYVMRRYSETLRNAIPSRLSPDQTLRRFVKILDAVEAAHLSGVWHRDIKPENILLGPSLEQIVVADFGIAHFGEDALHTAVETRDDARLANFSYAAPEQKVRGAQVDARADIFALGLILNELFTGEIPHGKAHKTIASAAPDFGYLDGLVDEMLSQAPDSRPATIGILKQQLIGRGNEFVALQRVETARKTVVPATQVLDIPTITFERFDYHEGRLVITLSHQPPAEWMMFFRSQPRGHTAVSGYGPERFTLTGQTISVPVPERLVTEVATHAKAYAANATQCVREARAESARQADLKAREELKRKIADEEARARILHRLNMLNNG